MVSQPPPSSLLRPPSPDHRFFFWAYFDIEICPFFEKNGHITNGHIYEFKKKWAYCKWAYFWKLPKNGNILNRHIPKYAHLLILHANDSTKLPQCGNTTENATSTIHFFVNGDISTLFWTSCHIANGHIFGVFKIMGILQMGIFTKNVK